jgi:hypothetical protein
VIPQLDNYRRSLANTSRQRPTIELLHQSSYEDYLSVNFYLFFIVDFFFCLNSSLTFFSDTKLTFDSNRFQKQR